MSSAELRLPVRILKILYVLLVPGGILLGCAVALAYFGSAKLAPPTLTFLYYSALLGGVLLSWRFHASRTFFALLVTFLATQALALAGTSHVRADSSDVLSFAAVNLLLPLNLVLIAISDERGLNLSSATPFALCLFVQAVVLAVLRESTATFPFAHHVEPLRVPTFIQVAAALAGATLLVRAVVTRKPADGAFFWSLVAFFLSANAHGISRISGIYSLAAPVILVSSVIESSYLLAYHDELTGLPSRRAFHEALKGLADSFAIAVVDIDHFKKFNDTHGHDVGDQVLRLVAARLADVTGGGQAFRYGGEEFVILFRGKSAAVALHDLERLRETIERAEFQMRGQERRQTPRGPDRRTGPPRNRERKSYANPPIGPSRPSTALRVTISIGVANVTSRNSDPDRVMQAADKALYRAKANGRNRVEVAAYPRRRGQAKATGVA